MSKGGPRECEESNIVRFHAQEEFVFEAKILRPCPAFISSVEHDFFWTDQTRPPLIRAALQLLLVLVCRKRRGCEVHGVLSAANDKSRNRCFTSRRERSCLWRKLFPVPRLAPVIRLLYPVTSKARAYFPLAAPNVASPAILLVEKLQAAWAYLKNRWSDWWSLLERIPP